MNNTIINFLKKDVIAAPKLGPLSLKENKSSHNNLLELQEMPAILLSDTVITDYNKPSPPKNILTETEEKTIPTNTISMYRLSLKWYGIYLLYGLFGGMFINLVSSSNVINYDMIFNIIISPIIYYNAPRKILTRITIQEFGLYYTIPFFCGLFFRFMDYIPMLNQLSLSFDSISSTVQIVLVCLFVIAIFVMIFYYIYISSEPYINLLLFIIMTLIITVTSYLFYNNNGNIHIHHYFVGLIIMLLSKNSKYKLVITIHAIGYAIYIEGVSKWGYAPIFWKN